MWGTFSLICHKTSLVTRSPCVHIIFGGNYYVIVRYCYHLIQVWYDMEMVKGEINDAIRTYIHASQFSNTILCC